MTKDLDVVHARALKNFEAAESALHDERAMSLEDRRFVTIAGAMWEGSTGEQFEGRPQFEVNKVALAVIRVINDYRSNKVTVNFLSKDGKQADELADACAGLFRADEQDSQAEEAYDNAFDEAVKGGFAAWRLVTEYENAGDPEDERQRIRFLPIYEADQCVFFDAASRRHDKSDAKHCHLLTAYTPDAYREEFDDEPQSWEKPTEANAFDWAGEDYVWVSEYYEIEDKKQTVHVYRDVAGDEITFTDADFESEEGLEEQLIATGHIKIKTRKISTKKVHKYILSGGGVLEDCGYIPGTEIPIVPVFGKRSFVGGIERVSGHVRDAKDAARLKNMQLSQLAEISARSPVEKPIFAPEQVKGLEQRWADSNITNYPFELANPVRNIDGGIAQMGPIGYTKPPQIPPALAALMQVTETDLGDLLGNQQQGEQMVSNVSGKAVEMIQQRIDMQSYIYISNFSKAIKRAAQIWLAMAREVYADKGRSMKIVGDDGEADSIEIMRPMDGAENGMQHDITRANLDVAVDVGPSSSSKKAATVRALTGMVQMTQDPETAQVLTSMAIMNMEGEGVADLRQFFRQKLIKIGAVKPTAKEQEQLAKEAANVKEDPNAIFMQAAAEEAVANAGKARAQTVKTVADAELTRAKTLEVMSTVDIDVQKQALEMAARLVPEEQMAAPDLVAQPVQDFSGEVPGDMQQKFINRLSNK